MSEEWPEEAIFQAQKILDKIVRGYLAGNCPLTYVFKTR
jgi:hypothetical protein